MFRISFSPYLYNGGENHRKLPLAFISLFFLKKEGGGEEER